MRQFFLREYTNYTSEGAWRSYSKHNILAYLGRLDAYLIALDARIHENFSHYLHLD